MNPASKIPHSAHCYTAAQLAVASRVSKRNTLIALDGIEPASEVIVQGNPASVWTFDLLPERMRETIVARARETQLPVADYLASAIKPWQPPLALSEVSSACLDDAKKLREALLPALQRIGAIMFDAPERVRLGLAEHVANGAGVTFQLNNCHHASGGSLQIKSFITIFGIGLVARNFIARLYGRCHSRPLEAGGRYCSASEFFGDGQLESIGR
jgi:hypothetical protein